MTTPIDELLWRWAAWTHSGSTRQNVTHFLRDSSGRSLGRGAAFEQDAYSIELRIEQAVSRLAAKHANQAHILRIEYSPRRSGEQSQSSRALALDLSLRTYQRHLKAAKDFVSQALYPEKKQ